MKLFSEFTKGLIQENPVLVLLLGLCPTLAVTTGVQNAIGMGLAATFVLVCSNFVISLVKRGVPSEVRIPVFIVIIASFVTVVKLVMAAYTPQLSAALGIFLPLIVVNCIILGRAEAFASRNPPLASLIDGLGMGVGFTLALLLIAAIREIAGAGTLAGIPLCRGIEAYTLSAIVLPPGGFLVLGLLLGFLRYLRLRREQQEELAYTRALQQKVQIPNETAKETA